jgi:hypothetical protein
MLALGRPAQPENLLTVERRELRLRPQDGRRARYGGAGSYWISRGTARECSPADPMVRAIEIARDARAGKGYS